MEGSRTRTILGVALLLLGSFLLLQRLMTLVLWAPLIAPIAPSPAFAPPAADEVERMIRIEEQRAQLEAQRSLLDAQRAASEHMPVGPEGDAHIAPMPPLPAIPAMPAMPEMPPLPAMPAMPPMPPVPPSAHLGTWINPMTVLLALLVLLVWRRGRGERASQQA